jgi:hypothetical protein
MIAFGVYLQFLRTLLLPLLYSRMLSRRLSNQRLKFPDHPLLALELLLDAASLLLLLLIIPRRSP